MTSVANTVAMTTFAVHTLQPLIFYRYLRYRTVNKPYWYQQVPWYRGTAVYTLQPR